MHPGTARRRSWIPLLSACLTAVAVPCAAQPLTLTPDEIVSLKARLPKSGAGDRFDADYQQEVVDVVSVFRRHNAMSPSALRDLELRYVPVFEAVAASTGRLAADASLTPEGHLAYSAEVRLRLQDEAALTGAWILNRSGVPRTAWSQAERIKAGVEALDHGIAYVVAHELAHREKAHNLSGALTLADRRARELAADWRAFEVLWQVRASLPLLRELLRVRAALDRTAETGSEASSSHPFWSTRVEQLDRFLSSHAPDLTRGGILVTRRWSGRAIEEELIVLRGGPPRWLGGVSPGMAESSTPLIQRGYVEPNGDGSVTLWTRQGRGVHRRHIVPLAGESTGWMRIRSYRQDGIGWTLQGESLGLASSLVRTRPGVPGADFVTLYVNNPGADMLSGVATGPTRDRLGKLQQQLEEERRGTWQSFNRGDFGMLELTDRDRLTGLRLQQLADQQGVGNEWANLLGNLFSSAANTPTARALGPAGLEALSRFMPRSTSPSPSYKTSDGRIEFRLPGKVTRMEAPPTTAGAYSEAYASIAGGMPYSMTVTTFPRVPSRSEVRSLALEKLLGAERAMAQGRQPEELDRRDFELSGGYVVEAAVQLSPETPVFRLRSMVQGRDLISTVSFLGSPNEYEVFDGWRVLAR